MACQSFSRLLKNCFYGRYAALRGHRQSSRMQRNMLRFSNRRAPSLAARFLFFNSLSGGNRQGDLIPSVEQFLR
jgi:hypothetical protein